MTRCASSGKMCWLALAVTLSLTPLLPIHAEEDYLKTEILQNQKNALPGKRFVPAKELSPPSNISPELKTEIMRPYGSPRWYANHARTNAEWLKAIENATAVSLKKIPEIKKALNVSLDEAEINGVRTFEIRPEKYRDDGKVVLYFHGGGYVYNPGLAGTSEAMMMAAYSGYKVIAVDYRMPPGHPFPAALDDALSVYKGLLQKYQSGSIAVLGTSAGGGLSMSLMLKIKQMGLPYPAVIGLGTPWMDLTPGGGGDSINTLEWVDNTIISARGYISRSAPLYANGKPLNDPFISPIFGDFSGLPPVILISGTRDLFLSQTVLTQRKLRKAGIVADLQLWDGMSHAQYGNYHIPEAQETFREIGRFFSGYLK